MQITVHMYMTIYTCIHAATPFGKGVIMYVYSIGQMWLIEVYIYIMYQEHLYIFRWYL